MLGLGGVQVGMSDWGHRPELLLVHCLYKFNYWLYLPHLDATLNQNHLCPLQLSICLGYCSLFHSVELRPRAGGVGANV